jgi:hypothetical protein
MFKPEKAGVRHSGAAFTTVLVAATDFTGVHEPELERTAKTIEATASATARGRAAQRAGAALAGNEVARR